MLKRLLLLLTIAFALEGIAQPKANITGIWKGYFYNDLGSARYKFEVQINNLTNNGLKGVTYSYRTTVFYGKAALQGVFMPKANNIVLKETKMLESKISDGSRPCLMTCYLTYSKQGNTEILEGSYTSENKEDGECGGGIVHLEKTTFTDFVKEDFIIAAEKKKSTTKPKSATPKPTIPIKLAPTNKPAKPTITNTTTNAATAKKPGNTNSKPKANTTQKPIANKPTLPTSVAKPDTSATIVATKPPIKVENSNNLPAVSTPKPILLPVPEILTERTNTTVKTVITKSKLIKITLYDNGEIDDDAVSVYHNNKLVIDNQKLTTKPLTYNIEANPADAKHTITIVANNEGRIPPNTALVVIETDGKRYELIASTNTAKNASIEFSYQP